MTSRVTLCPIHLASASSDARTACAAPATPRPNFRIWPANREGACPSDNIDARKLYPIARTPATSPCPMPGTATATSQTAARPRARAAARSPCRMARINGENRARSRVRLLPARVRCPGQQRRPARRRPGPSACRRNESMPDGAHHAETAPDRAYACYQPVSDARDSNGDQPDGGPAKTACRRDESMPDRAHQREKTAPDQRVRLLPARVRYPGQQRRPARRRPGQKRVLPRRTHAGCAHGREKPSDNKAAAMNAWPMAGKPIAATQVPARASACARATRPATRRHHCSAPRPTARATPAIPLTAERGTTVTSQTAVRLTAYPSARSPSRGYALQ